MNTNNQVKSRVEQIVQRLDLIPVRAEAPFCTTVTECNQIIKSPGTRIVNIRLKAFHTYSLQTDFQSGKLTTVTGRSRG